MGKGKNAGNGHFLLFSQYFKPIKRQSFSFLVTFILWANAFNLDMSEILSFGKELVRIIKELLSELREKSGVRSNYTCDFRAVYKSILKNFFKSSLTHD